MIPLAEWPRVSSRENASEAIWELVSLKVCEGYYVCGAWHGMDVEQA